jgi:hypothetical protein
LALIISIGTVFAESENNNKTSDKEYKTTATAITSNSKEKENSGYGVSGTEQTATLKPNGDFKVTGVKVNSVSASTNTLNVSLYGISRDINVGNAKISGGSKKITINDIMAGDVLYGSGNYNANTKTATISEITNVTYKTRASSDIQAQINKLLEMIKQLQAQIGH